jgi:hypothetical protein
MTHFRNQRSYRRRIDRKRAAEDKGKAKVVEESWDDLINFDTDKEDVDGADVDGADVDGADGDDNE